MYLKTNSKLNNNWSDKYLGLIKATAKRLKEFTAYEVRQAFSRSKLEHPPKPTCIAPCFRRAIKMGIMKRTGEFKKTEYGVYQPIYRSMIFQDREEGSKTTSSDQ